MANQTVTIGGIILMEVAAICHIGRMTHQQQEQKVMPFILFL